MIPRIIRAVFAAVITLGLFLGMRYLILPSGNINVDEGDPPNIVVTRQKRDETSKEKSREMPTEPQQVTPPPPPSITQQDVVLDQSGKGITYEMLKEWNGDGGVNIGQENRRAIPIVKIPPEYPHREQVKGREGWVLLEFTITSAGTVEDIVVVDADPKNAFESVSIRSLKRWKYQPKMVEGKPVPQYRMQELFSFQITQ